MGLVLAAVSTLAVAAPVNHHGEVLVRVEATPHEVEALGLDVWTHHAAVPSVVARVVPSRRAALDASGYAYEVLDPDLGVRVADERARRLVVPPVLGGLDPAYHDGYHELPEVLARLDALAVASPKRVSMVEVGTSLEGRPIRGVRITNPGPAVRPAVLVQGCQHAREWISPAAIMFAAEQLVTATDGSSIDLLLDDVAVVVVPVVNPDGYAYSWDEDRLWRKNRRDEHGVDLNRNWAVAWGGEGSSPDPESGNYRGTAAFSEPETDAMRAFVESEGALVALLDVHSYGQLVLWPWGFAVGVEAEDDALFESMSVGIADVMTAPYDRFYEPMQGADFYPAAGNVADWAYGEHGLYAIGLELRPGGDEEAGFLLSEAHIVPTGEELLAGILELAEASIELGPGSPGDDGDVDVTDTGLDGTTGSASGGSASGGGPGGGTVEGTAGGSDGGLGTMGGDSPFDDTGVEPGGTGEGAVDVGASAGCGCRSDRGATGVAWWAWAALGLGLRRRRRGVRA